MSTDFIFPPAIYRAVDIYTKYAKNHTTPLKKRVPLLDRLSRDWIIYDCKTFKVRGARK